MGRKIRTESPDGFYKITVLKNDEIAFFRDKSDYEKIYDILKKEISARNIEIMAYAFTKNSINIIIKEELFCNVPFFIGSVLRRYAMYYKKKYSYFDKIFKKRYCLFPIKKTELAKEIVFLHNRVLKDISDEKDRLFSSFSDYFIKEELCATAEVFSFLDKETFYMMHFFGNTNEKNDNWKAYICEFLGIDNYSKIKTINKCMRNSLIKNLYYEKGMSVCEICKIVSLTRQSIYSILKS